MNGGNWVDTNGDGDADAGEHVVYQLLVVNVGTVTLDSIVLTDGSVTSEGVSCEPAIPDSLMPWESFTCHSTYTVSETCTCWIFGRDIGRWEASLPMDDTPHILRRLVPVLKTKSEVFCVRCCSSNNN